MFTNKQTLRNLVFSVFCVLILTISFALTYYITFSQEENYQKVEVIKIENKEICQETYTVINSFYLKIVLAFFAGGIVSDRLFLKLGVF
jgi:hypothetical protein